MIQIVDSTKQQGEPVDNNKKGKPVDNKEGERKGVIGIIPTTSGLGHRQGKIYSYGEELPKFSQGFHPKMTQQEFNSIRYLNQSTTSRVANAIGQAGVGLVAMLGSGIGYIADIPDLVRRANGYEGEVGNWLSDLMDNMREDYQEYAPINVENADMHGPRFSA